MKLKFKCTKVCRLEITHESGKSNTVAGHLFCKKKKTILCYVVCHF